MFSKKDLKSGMIVENEIGNYFLVVDDMLIYDDNYILLDRFNDDLTSNLYYAIIKVWEIKEPFHRYLRVPCNLKDVEQKLKPIFNREEEVDWSKIEVDAKVLVSINGQDWCPRHFAKYKNNEVYVWCDGCTSFTVEDEEEYKTWEYVKLCKE